MRLWPAVAAALMAAAAMTTALAAEDAVAIVRSLRAESNAAIAARDAKRLRPLLADDYETFVTLSYSGSSDCQSVG